ncbi:MAG: hypothetical protein M3O70_06155 [Actinomycetota bacterium]|nr:hypothetical protein [Actinomycetota bacterium]
MLPWFRARQDRRRRDVNMWRMTSGLLSLGYRPLQWKREVCVFGDMLERLRHLDEQIIFGRTDSRARMMHAMVFVPMATLLLLAVIGVYTGVYRWLMIGASVVGVTSSLIGIIRGK